MRRIPFGVLLTTEEKALDGIGAAAAGTLRLGWRSLSGLSLGWCGPAPIRPDPARSLNR